MSHAATNWAIEQRGLKPATKLVLWHLCDRHNPDRGCFPSQERLAVDCEMSRSSLNDHLKKLEESGLIKRERSIGKLSKKLETTRYFFAFEDEKTLSEIRTRISAETLSEKDEKPCPKNAKNLVRNSDTNPVREPVREPLSADAAGGEGENNDLKEKEVEDPKSIERHFKQVGPRWPSWVADSEVEARKAWVGLTHDEREQADKRMSEYLALVKGMGKSYTCALSKYFREKQWEKLPDLKAEREKPTMAKPYGKAWIAHRMQLLAKPRRGWQPNRFQQKMIDAGKEKLFIPDRLRAEFPLVSELDSQAANGRPMSIRPEMTLPDYSGFQQVEVGTDLWKRWQDWHEANDFPKLEPPSNYHYVWLPPDLPETPPKAPSSDDDQDYIEATG